MNHYVYEITNLVNGKKYIGKRSCKCSIEYDNYMGSGTLLKKAFDKYGIENFRKEVLFICESEEHAYAKEWIEILKIRTLKNWDDYYNIAYGGEGVMTGRIPWNKGKKGVYSKDHLEKLINSHRGQKAWNKGVAVSDEQKARQREKMLGRTHSDETKAKLSKLAKGRKLTEYQKYKLSESLKGKKKGEMSDSHKSAISKALKGKMPKNIEKIKGSNKKRVVCLNDLSIFESMESAKKHINHKSYSSISQCCRGKRKSAGKINGEPARWMYYEDYLKINYRE